MGFISQREAFGMALLEYGAQNTKVVVLDADTSSSTMSKFFAGAFPERFINVGIAEPCLVDAAVGMALGGYVPFISAFSALLSLRALEEIRTCVAYAQANVKIAAGYAGLSDYKDGPTHHSIIDIGIMRMLPGMTVIVPADEVEIKEWIPVIADHDGPVFIRLSRAGCEVVHQSKPKVQVGKGFLIKDGTDVSIISAGSMVIRSLKAAEVLENEGISVCVIDMPSIKPLDEEMILEASVKTKALVTAEEHSILGGLGSAVAELVTAHQLVPVERVGIHDVFTRTAPDPDTLMDAFGMSVDDVVNASKTAIKRKEITRS
jgi:transketolase